MNHQNVPTFPVISCEHKSARLTATVIRRGKEEVVCEDCYQRLKDDLQKESLRISPLVDSECFLCLSKPSRFNKNFQLNICDVCRKQDESQHLTHKEPMRGDVEPDVISFSDHGPEIFVGPKESARSGDQLRSLNIRQVLVCCSHLPLYLADDPTFRIHRLPMADSLDEDLNIYLKSALAFIAQGVRSDPCFATLIHCNAGISRSGAVAVAWLMATRGLGVDEAVSMAKAQRGKIFPNSNFIEQLRQFHLPTSDTSTSVDVASRDMEGEFAESVGGVPITETILPTKGADGSDGAVGPPAEVILLGDSTLDNVVWVPDQESSVTGKLARLGVKVRNWAADGFTTTDVLEGAPPLISRSKRAALGDPFPAGAFDHFRPLDHVKSCDVTRPCVALSIGGNDIRHILHDMSSVTSVVPTLQRNYADILTQLLGLGCRVIIVMQYRPCFVKGENIYGVYEAMDSLPGPGSSVEKMNTLMSVVYAPIIDLARSHKIPIIDLPNSFNINDKGLYECQIEPSARGGELIANMIAHVMNRFPFDDPERVSTFFSLPPTSHRQVLGGDGAVSDNVTIALNDGAHPWRVLL